MPISTAFHPMSPDQFAAFGLFKCAYIKPVRCGDVTLYAVYAADGTLLSRLPDRVAARLMVCEDFAMQPVSVH